MSAQYSSDVAADENRRKEPIADGIGKVQFFEMMASGYASGEDLEAKIHVVDRDHTKKRAAKMTNIKPLQRVEEILWTQAQIDDDDGIEGDGDVRRTVTSGKLPSTVEGNAIWKRIGEKQLQKLDGKQRTQRYWRFLVNPTR